MEILQDLCERVREKNRAIGVRQVEGLKADKRSICMIPLTKATQTVNELLLSLAQSTNESESPEQCLYLVTLYEVC